MADIFTGTYKVSKRDNFDKFSRNSVGLVLQNFRELWDLPNDRYQCDQAEAGAQL